MTYLEQQLTTQLEDYDTTIEWDTKNHAIVLEFTLFAENSVGTQIDDKEGVSSDEAIIEFEDALLFYHPEKTKFDPNDYLTTIPYEGKKGIKKATIEAVVLYLKEVLLDGESDLMDFLADETVEVFELNWSEQEFQRIETECSAKEQEISYLPYPSY